MKNHPMKVVDGLPGVTTVTVYEYRGHKITQRFRSYDSRNKTHNGYDWNTDLGQPIGNTRKRAKELIDRHVGQAKADPAYTA